MMHSYLCGVSLIPTAHAANTVYFSLFNNDPGEVGVHQLSIETMSATGSGNTRCTYVLARASGTRPTDGHYMAHKCNCPKGIILYPGQGIVLFNDNEGIEGASIHGCMEISYTED